MLLHLPFPYPHAPLVSWNSLAPLLCLLVLSTSLPIPQKVDDEWMDEWIETEENNRLIPEPIQSKAKEEEGGKEEGEDKREDYLEILWRKEEGEDYGDETEKVTGQPLDQENDRDSHPKEKATEDADEEEDIMDSNEDYMDSNEDSNEDYAEPLDEPTLTPQTIGNI